MASCFMRRVSAAILGVLGGLLLLVGVELSEDGGGGFLELGLGVLAVGSELSVNSVELTVEVESHLVELTVGLLVILGDGLLELGIVLEVLTVALVTELDHASHLSVDVGVNLSLGSGVGTDNTGGAVDVVVDLGNLLLDLRTELEEANLERGGGLGDLGRGLSAGTSDVGNSLSVTLVLESLLGVEGSLETHGSLTKSHID